MCLDLIVYRLEIQGVGSLRSPTPCIHFICVSTAWKVIAGPGQVQVLELVQASLM